MKTRAPNSFGMAGRLVAAGLVVAALACPARVAHAQLPPELPLRVADDAWAPLYDRVDSTLQANLEKRLAQDAEWAGLIAKKKMAVGIVDLTDLEQARFARVNGREMVYAASLPKIAILLAVQQSLEDEEIEETPELVEDMSNMIRFSSNRAAARLYNLVGFDKIRGVLTDPRYRLFDEGKGGGLWVGKPYSKVGRRRGDPLKDISHAATVTQVCRFYYLMATGRLINRERSQAMLEIMSAPGIHHKFVHALDARAPDAELYRKSGTWRQWHADSVLVWGPKWRRYILVAMVESRRGSKIIEAMVSVAEEVLQR